MDLKTQYAPHSNAAWSDASSSIYSTDDHEPPMVVERDTRPLIDRKPSQSATSTRSTTSQASTVYSEEFIKTLGYRPFEYWKPPKSSRNKYQHHHQHQHHHRRPPPPPPPARIHELPRSSTYLGLSSTTSGSGPLRSPRVKDRYAARMARLRDGGDGDGAWPGWVPDEKVRGPQTNRTALDAVGMQASSSSSSSSRPWSVLSPSAFGRWAKPSTWRRRVWAWLVSGVVLLLIAGGVLVTVWAQGVGTSPSVGGVVAAERAASSGMVAAVVMPDAVAAGGSRRLVARRFVG